ncbi:MAG: hypothetical protein EBU14_09360 [Acetobacteraceae bacterium]|nr:hypothetical protein [Acetobacteraceae bacterium]
MAQHPGAWAARDLPNMAPTHARNCAQQGARHGRHGRHTNAARSIWPGCGFGFHQCSGEVRALSAQILRAMIELQLTPFGFYPSEYNGAVLGGLKINTFISNDGAWGTELHGQLKALGRSVNTELGFLRYDKVGEGFGCRGEHVEQLAQLRPALERALAHDGPTVINVLIDREAGATLKTDSRVQMILFDDLASNLKTQHSFAG